MEIHFKGTNYELAPEITSKTQKKVKALKKFLGGNARTVHAYVELGKETNRHQNGDIWRAEVNFDTQGTMFRAVAVRDTLENAIDEAVNELGKELRRSKKKNESLVRRGGAVLKDIARGFRSRGRGFSY